MVDQFIPEHHIQKHIISVLIHQQYARFRDMRPPNVDTNLYSYHLKLLQKRQMVQKTDKGYCLDKAGLLYVDRVSLKSLNIRTQPKIITMIVLQNADGDVLLQKRAKQPHIDTWTLPYGKLHIDRRFRRRPSARHAKSWVLSSWTRSTPAIAISVSGNMTSCCRLPWHMCFMPRPMTLS